MNKTRTNPTQEPSLYTIKDTPRIHVMLYSWNKGLDLENTIRSLAQSKYSNYKLFVLNNGSADDTIQRLHAIKKEKIIDNMSIIDLPINIGAPAARNWLANLEENEYSDFICYLDDDIILPPQWMEEMIATFEKIPDAGVVGAKILFNDPVKRIQHTGGTITKTDDWIHSIEAFSYQEDQGQHDYIAERHYTMGCCHMYRTEVFKVCGDFDLRFAPTQFDEVEQQIRMRLFGYKAIYNGFIEVKHLMKTGSNPSKANQTSREANRLKMLPLLEPNEVEFLVNENLLNKTPRYTQPLYAFPNSENNTQNLLDRIANLSRPTLGNLS